MATLRLKLGDSFEVLKEMDNESVGSVCTDPPYLIAFMNKKWDKLDDAHAQQAWHREWLAEVFRVLKPGGVIKVFSATRTFHRLAAAMVDVGFVDLDFESWIYGSGFPKSLNLHKNLGKTEFPNTDDYEGYGTALKSAWEIFVVATKPETGGL